MTTKSAVFAMAMALTIALPAFTYAQATTSGLAVQSSHIGQLHSAFIDDGANTQIELGEVVERDVGLRRLVVG